MQILLMALGRSDWLTGMLAVLARIASFWRHLDPIAYLQAKRAQRLLGALQELLAAFQAGTLPPEPQEAPARNRKAPTPQPRPRALGTPARAPRRDRARIEPQTAEIRPIRVTLPRPRRVTPQGRRAPAIRRAATPFPKIGRFRADAQARPKCSVISLIT